MLKTMDANQKFALKLLQPSGNDLEAVRGEAVKFLYQFELFNHHLAPPCIVPLVLDKAAAHPRCDLWVEGVERIDHIGDEIVTRSVLGVECCRVCCEDRDQGPAAVGVFNVEFGVLHEPLDIIEDIGLCGGGLNGEPLIDYKCISSGLLEEVCQDLVPESLGLGAAVDTAEDRHGS